MALLTSALTTLAAVKAYIPNATDPSNHDANLEGLINGISLRFENHTHRRLKERTYKPTGAVAANGEENLKLNGNDRLTPTQYILPEFPVSVVTAVVIRDRNMQVVKTLDVATDLVVDPKSGIMHLIDGDVWEKGVQNLEITWTAGLNPVPADLELACIIQVLNDFYVIDRGRLGVKSINVQGELIMLEHKSLLDRVKGTLDFYRMPLAG